MPRHQFERSDRLTAHFLPDGDVQARLAGRRGDRAITTLELFAVGGAR